MIDFTMPSLGADMEAGTLAEWLVKPGDRVKRGDIVAVVDTQKGAIDIEIFHEGTVAELVVPVGAEAPVGAVLARLNGASAETAAPRHPPAPPPMPAAPAPPPPPPIAVAVPPSAAGRARVTPAARRAAAERGIDLQAIAGTGPEGAITLRDLPLPAPPAAGTEAPRRRVGFDAAAMRQAIAAAMTRSKREIPHYYLGQTVDLSRALAALDGINRDRAPTERVLPAALLLRATARALAKTPELNGFWQDRRLRAGDGVHIGWAIALRGGGLVAPAIRDADRRTLDEVMAAMRDLVQRARGGGLRSSEISDPTITVTSSRRSRRGKRAADHLSAASRHRRLRPCRDASLGRRWGDRGAPAGVADARRRPSGERRPPRRPATGRDRSFIAGAGNAVNDAEAKQLVVDILAGIAPEADFASLHGDAELREELDLELDGLPQFRRGAASAHRDRHLRIRLSPPVHAGRSHRLPSARLTAACLAAAASPAGGTSSARHCRAVA